MPFLTSPSCLCCEACPICSDDFDRADDTDISTGSDCGWTEDAGNPSISSNKLRFTTTDAIATSNTKKVGGNVHVSVKVTFDTSGDKARIYLDYQDSNNFKYVELLAGNALSGHARIGEVVAGSDSAIDTETGTITVPGTHTLIGCISDDGVFSGGGSGLSLAATGYAPSNDTFGLGTGDTVGGNVDFDDFVATVVSDECEVCAVPCNGCSGGEAPAAIPLSWTPPGDCNYFQNDYILDWTGSGCIWNVTTGFSGPVVQPYCKWELTQESPPFSGQVRWVATLYRQDISGLCTQVEAVYKGSLVTFGSLDCEAQETLTQTSGSGTCTWPTTVVIN